MLQAPPSTLHPHGQSQAREIFQQKSQISATEDILMVENRCKMRIWIDAMLRPSQNLKLLLQFVVLGGQEAEVCGRLLGVLWFLFFVGNKNLSVYT